MFDNLNLPVYIDLGISKKITNNQKAKTAIGTEWAKAP
jgi:hypothetical protein